MSELAKSGLKFLGVIAVTVGVALAISEMMLRMLGLYSPYTMRTDYIQGRHSNAFIDRPGWKWEFDVNSDGFRTPALGPKAADETRIVVIGDSHTWGAGLADDERFTNLLEGAMRQGGRNVRVINLGLNAITYRHFAQLADWAERLQPDLTIVMSYLGNDPGETFLRPWRRVDQHVKPNLREYAKRVFRQSHVYTLVLFKLRQQEISAMTVTEGRTVTCGLPTPPEENSGRHSQFMEQHCWFQVAPDKLAAAQSAIAGDIAGLGESLAARKRRGVLLLLPSAPGVGLSTKVGAGAKVAAGQMGLNMELAVETEARLEAYIADIGRRHMGCVLDLAPLLRAQADRQELYFPIDWHLNQAGQKLVAKHVQGLLSRHLASTSRECT